MILLSLGKMEASAIVATVVTASGNGTGCGCGCHSLSGKLVQVWFGSVKLTSSGQGAETVGPLGQRMVRHTFSERHEWARPPLKILGEVAFRVIPRAG